MDDEYISREAFKAEALRLSTHYLNEWDTLGVLAAADRIPSADVAPVRHGRWNEESPDCLDGDSVYVCSVCGETWTLIEGTPLDNNMHYCPNCGAKMDGGKEDGT